jgi:hypothetical protein
MSQSNLSMDILIKNQYVSCNTQSDFQRMRHLLREYGLDKFKQEMIDLGIFHDGYITSNLIPFNPFARIIANKMENPCKDIINNENYVILQNRPENDDHWNDSDPIWLGKASMSKNHKFLSPKINIWSCFNVLTLGIDDSFDLEKSIKMLDTMKILALNYTKQKLWSSNIGLYFHCYPFNSVQTLHLHIVDLDTIGPSFYALQHKNLSLDDIKNVLLEEKNMLHL